jgi:hypothetical protein
LITVLQTAPDWNRESLESLGRIFLNQFVKSLIFPKSRICNSLQPNNHEAEVKACGEESAFVNYLPLTSCSNQGDVRATVFLLNPRRGEFAGEKRRARRFF